MDPLPSPEGLDSEDGEKGKCGPSQQSGQPDDDPADSELTPPEEEQKGVRERKKESPGRPGGSEGKESRFEPAHENHKERQEAVSEEFDGEEIDGNHAAGGEDEAQDPSGEERVESESLPGGEEEGPEGTEVV